MRKLIAEVEWRHPEPGKSSVMRRGSGEDHVVTEVVSASQTIVASPAGITWLDSNLVAGFQRTYCTADFDDGARGFVT